MGDIIRGVPGIWYCWAMSERPERGKQNGGREVVIRPEGSRCGGQKQSIIQFAEWRYWSFLEEDVVIRIGRKAGGCVQSQLNFQLSFQ